MTTDNNQPIHILAPVSSNLEMATATSSDDKLAELLLAHVDLNDQGVYFESECLVCSTPSRQEAEEMWLKDRDAKEACDFLKSKGEPAPITVVKNHMEYHIDQSYVELRKREYIKKLIQLGRFNMDTLSRVGLALSCMQQQIIAMGASEDGSLSPASLNKLRSDSMCKLVSSMTSLLQLRANLLGEMKMHGEAFSIRRADFEEIFTEALKNKHPEVRKAINELLEKFTDAVQRQ